MDKKKYISPAVDELVYISVGILAGSNSGNITIGGEGDDKVDTGESDNMSAGKRGTWGSLWQ